MAKSYTEGSNRVAESALTIAEVAAALHRSPEYVYRLVTTGRLPGAQKELGRWLVPARVVRSYVKAMQR